MDKWEEGFKVGMELFSAMMMSSCVNNMLRAMIAPEMEKKIGRKLTDWEWAYYLNESQRKADVGAWQKARRLWQQRCCDLQIIHDFVWNDQNKS